MTVDDLNTPELRRKFFVFTINGDYPQLWICYSLMQLKKVEPN